MRTYRRYAWKLFWAYYTGQLPRGEYYALSCTLARQRRSWRYN